jgi:hypothetical protein
MRKPKVSVTDGHYAILCLHGSAPKSITLITRTGTYTSIPAAVDFDVAVKLPFKTPKTSVGGEQ